MLKSRVNALIEIVLLLIISLSLFLQGAVAEWYWYPLGLLILIAFGVSLLGWEQGWISGLRLTGMEPYFIAWAALMIISGLFSPHRWSSVFALERYLAGLLFFYLMLWYFRDKMREKILLWFLFALPVAISLIGLGMFLTRQKSIGILPDNLSAVSGTLVNHNNFAGLVILGFFLGLGLMMSLSRKSKEFDSEDIARRVILSFPLLLLLLALTFSLSRSGWISFFLSALAYSLWLALGPRRKRIRIYLAMLLGVILATIILSLTLNRDVLGLRAGTLNDFLDNPASGLTFSGRKMLWQSTLLMIRDHPLLGIGPGAFWAEYPQYRRFGEFHGESHSHNDLLQLAAESGVPSALVLVLLLIKAFRVWLKNYRRGMNRFQRRVSIGIIFGILGFFLQDQFDFHFHIPGLTYYFLALSAFLLKTDPGERQE